MEQKPIISVCMITYGHEEYIKQAVEGVLMQEIDFDVELIIADDCSPDNTFDLVNKLKTEHKNGSWIKYTRHSVNKGMMSNFVWGLQQCQGKYIALCDGDDYWTDPLKLQKQVGFLESNPSFSICFTRFKVKYENVWTDDKNGHYFKNQNKEVSFDFEKFEKGWHGGVPTLMFRTSAFNVSIAFKYKYFRDVYLFTELLKKGKGVCLASFTSVYRVHDRGIHNSATLLERAKIGSMCYKELYLKNKEIICLKRKYRTFHRNYINQLIIRRKLLLALYQILYFGIRMNDLPFILEEFKRVLKKIKFKQRIKKVLKKERNNTSIVFDSKDYWEKRYKSNRNSGSGSYGRLAEFKAEILNEFVRVNKISTVIEYGTGDGNQLSLAKYPKYKGFDVSQTALKYCKSRFVNDNTKEFFLMSDNSQSRMEADLTLSLDVVYHLVEDDVFKRYMERLFNTASKFVIIYSCNYNKEMTKHVKCRKFTDWIENNVSPKWKLKEIIKNRYPFEINDPLHTSISDFYIYEKSL